MYRFYYTLSHSEDVYYKWILTWKGAEEARSKFEDWMDRNGINAITWGLT